jgi:hypothetical protein
MYILKSVLPTRKGVVPAEVRPNCTGLVLLLLQIKV